MVLLMGCGRFAAEDALTTPADAGPSPGPTDAGADGGPALPPHEDAAAPAIGVLQTANASETTAELVVPLDRLTQAGSTLIVATCNANALDPLVGIHDDKGNAYVSAKVLAKTPGCNVASEIWYAKNVAPGTGRVTVSLTKPELFSGWLLEAAGLSIDAPLDAVKTVESPPAADVIVAPTVRPSSARSLVVSTTCSCHSVTGMASDSPFQPLAVREGNTTAWLVTDAAGDYGAKWTQSVTASYSASTAAFKP